eukprot:TRINITY_DN13303_c0_g3_i1.p1 TRINITY_DN13303_c0_g3~~TRINITY_DN13303_c0_g3_i1.p1  ORF type:complete len:510 (+),score=53.77 TRINITY_DN13303_c0_g3_i1:44-1573(+)
MDHARAQTALQALEKGLRYSNNSSNTRSATAIQEVEATATPTRRLDLNESIGGTSTTSTFRSASVGLTSAYDYRKMMSPPPAPEPTRHARPLNTAVTHRRVPSPSFVNSVRIPTVSSPPPNPMYNSLIRDLRVPRRISPPRKPVVPVIPSRTLSKPVQSRGISPSLSPRRVPSMSPPVPVVTEQKRKNPVNASPKRIPNPFLAEIASSGLSERCLDYLVKSKEEVQQQQRNHDLFHYEGLPDPVVFNCIRACINDTVGCLVSRGDGVIVVAPFAAELKNTITARNDVFITSVSGPKDVITAPTETELEAGWVQRHSLVVMQTPGLCEECSDTEMSDIIFWTVSKKMHFLLVGGDDRSAALVKNLPETIKKNVHIIRKSPPHGALYTFNDTLATVSGYLAGAFSPLILAPSTEVEEYPKRDADTEELSRELSDAGIAHFITPTAMWLNLTTHITTAQQEVSHHKKLLSLKIHTQPGTALHLTTPGWFLLTDYDGVPLSDLSTLLRPKNEG